MKEKIAIIDIGSNTTRLVIYEKQISGMQYRAIENIKRATRLRSYLDDQHLLNEKGILLLIETLKEFQMMLRSYDVTEVICAATATIRQAQNKERIIQLVQERTGLVLNILSEYEEAYYGYLAVVHSIDIKDGITIDMGGGSTELTYFQNRKLVDYISLPFGSLSLKSQFVKGATSTEEELLHIRNYIQAQFAKVPWLANKHIPIIAMGGSARNAAQIHQGFIQYPLAGIHQYEMKVSDILDLKERVGRLSLTELQNLEGLSKDRTDTILPAIEVFDILCEVSKASGFILSRKGLREGILLTKKNLAEKEFSALVDSNIHELIRDYHLDLHKGEQIQKNAVTIIRQLKEIKGFDMDFSSKDLSLIKRAACLFQLGRYKNEESSACTFYLLANRTIIGLSHRERVKLALVASFKGKGAFRQYIEPFKNWFSKEERKKLGLLGAILKISQSLNTSERNIVQDIKITSQDDCLIMDIYCRSNYDIEQYQLERQKKHFDKILKNKLVPKFHLIKV